MTDEWPEGKENYYIAIVIVHRGDSTVCRCSDYISPEYGEWASVSVNLVSGLL